jgi:hypothetical protein
MFPSSSNERGSCSCCQVREAARAPFNLPQRRWCALYSLPWQFIWAPSSSMFFLGCLRTEANTSPAQEKLLWIKVGVRAVCTQRESPKVRGIAGHIEQAARGAIRTSPQAHKHFYSLLPTAMIFVSYGFVLVQVQVQVRAVCQKAAAMHRPRVSFPCLSVRFLRVSPVSAAVEPTQTEMTQKPVTLCCVLGRWGACACVRQKAKAAT